MIKKLAVFLIIAVIYCTSASSQIDFGIRGGVNFNWPGTYSFSQPGYEYRLAIQNTLRTGFHFGLVSQVKLFKILIQPELIFTSINNNIEYEEVGDGEIHVINQEFNRLDMPVLALIKIKSFKIELGPVGSVLLKDKSDLFDETGYRQKFKKATIGYQAGIGIEISKLTFDLKYEGSLSKFGDGIEIGDNTFSFDPRTNQLILSLGVFF
ncbi:MAG: PorT family protein [Bacteroidales bacterium]|nr:MAG: PorT family protein [Bacteroidales bacterium]